MKNNQRGFGLLETLISVLILSWVTYTVIQQTEIFSNSKRKMNFNQEVVEASTLIRDSLRDPVICKNFVLNQPIGQVDYSSSNVQLNGPRVGKAIGGEITKPLPSKNNDKTIAQAGSELNGRGVSINNIQIVNDGAKDFVRVTFEKQARWSSGSIGGNIITKDILLKGTKDLVTNTLLDCRAEEVILDAQAQCKNLRDATWNPVTSLCELNDIYLKRPVALVPMYLTGAVLQTEILVKAGMVSCHCSDLRCTKSANCKCALPTCAAPLRTEFPPRRVTHVGGFLGVSKECDMEAICYRVIPASQTPIGYLVNP